MSTIRKPKSTLALKAALDVLGPCHPHTAAYLIFRAAAVHLASTLGERKASELTYDVADDLATGEKL
jgi:hypothetical protein